MPALTRHQKEARKISSLEHLLGSQSHWHLDFKLLASSAQRINSCCFKPPTHQYFIMEALGNWYTHPVHILPGLPHFLNAISRTIRKWASFPSQRCRPLSQPPQTTPWTERKACLETHLYQAGPPHSGILSQRSPALNRKEENQPWKNAVQNIWKLIWFVVPISSHLHHLDQTQANARNQQTISAKLMYKVRQSVEKVKLAVFSQVVKLRGGIRVYLSRQRASLVCARPWAQSLAPHKL